MYRLSYDLHIHSCLSPCGDEDMTPVNIVNMAKLKKLEIIAITDHNSCGNCPAELSLAQKAGIIAIPGMELCTAEEVHVLCLFYTLEDAMHFHGYVSDKLMKIPNNEKVFGKQEMYDEMDRRIGTEKYLLINATEIPFDNLGELMREYSGIYIPAHIDKSSNSLISNLGIIPKDSDFTCVEVKESNRIEALQREHPYLTGCNIITNSDAHSLGRIKEPVSFLSTESKNRKDILGALMNQTSHYL